MFEIFLLIMELTTFIKKIYLKKLSFASCNIFNINLFKNIF